ncbi:hypothetical protein F4X86_03185 [Candidatus Saccharibacteria bacterium]|nr:hypothetical protein [Candidatus Saccharibacteria bacterium]
MNEKLEPVVPAPSAGLGGNERYDWSLTRKITLFAGVAAAAVAGIILTDFPLFTATSVILTVSYLYLYEIVDDMLVALANAARRLPKTVPHFVRAASFSAFLFIQAVATAEYLGYLQLGNSDDHNLALLRFSALDAVLVAGPGIILMISYFGRKLEVAGVWKRAAWLVLLAGAAVGAAMLGAYYANLDSSAWLVGLLAPFAAAGIIGTAFLAKIGVLKSLQQAPGQAEKTMKTILVDAIDCLVLRDGSLLKPMHDLLESYPNRKIVLTGADDEQAERFGLNRLPYEVFSLKHDPEKTDPAYYRIMLVNYNLDSRDVVYFEHNRDACESAKSAGITTLFYDHKKEDMAELKAFLDTNLN